MCIRSSVHIVLCRKTSAPVLSPWSSQTAEQHNHTQLDFGKDALTEKTRDHRTKAVLEIRMSRETTPMAKSRTMQVTVRCIYTCAYSSFISRNNEHCTDIYGKSWPYKSSVISAATSSSERLVPHVACFVLQVNFKLKRMWKDNLWWHPKLRPEKNHRKALRENYQTTLPGFSKVSLSW